VATGCAPGYVCLASSCAVPVGAGSLCGSCLAGQKCDNGVCCATGPERCCTSSTLCPNGLSCNTVASTCYGTCNDFDDSRCVDPATYCDGDTCVAKLAAGMPCVADRQCALGTCVEGVCCATTCDGVCESCRRALNGVSDGSCAPIHLGGQDLLPTPACGNPAVGCIRPSCACDGAGSGASHCRAGVGQSCVIGADCITDVCVCIDDPCTAKKCVSG
jgi:hypothetical protein